MRLYSTPSPRLTTVGLPGIIACVKARAASAASARLARLEQALADAVPEPADDRDLDDHFRDALRWA